jgi:lipopolysaccharide transport system ATP-binding protein
VAEKEGRTVLFVSHTMSAIVSLCHRVLWLAQGKTMDVGEPNAIVGRYLLAGAEKSGEIQIPPQDNPDPRFFLKALRLRNDLGEITSVLDVLKPIKIEIDYYLSVFIENLEISLRITHSSGTIVCSSDRSQFLKHPVRMGSHSISVQIPALFLVPGIYSISLAAHVPTKEILAFYEDLLSLEIEETGSPMAVHHGRNYGMVFANWTWLEKG